MGPVRPSSSSAAPSTNSSPPVPLPPLLSPPIPPTAAMESRPSAQGVRASYSSGRWTRTRRRRTDTTGMYSLLFALPPSRPSFLPTSPPGLCDEGIAYVYVSPLPPSLPPSFPPSLPCSYWYIHGKAYDLAPFISTHPGGEHALLLARGRDGTSLFESYHPFSQKPKEVSSTLSFPPSFPPSFRLSTFLRVDMPPLVALWTLWLTPFHLSLPSSLPSSPAGPQEIRCEQPQQGAASPACGRGGGQWVGDGEGGSVLGKPGGREGGREGSSPGRSSPVHFC